MSDRKNHGVAFWATMGLVVVLAGYPLTFGPACCWFVPQTEGDTVSILSLLIGCVYLNRSVGLAG